MSVFCSTLLKIYVYIRVSFSAVDIVISKEEEIFDPKILMMETTIYFLGWWFGYLEDKQKPVWTMKNYPGQKLKLLSPPNRYIYFFFRKAFILCEVLLKHWNGLKLGFKFFFFFFFSTKDFFEQNIILFKNCCHTTLYLLDLFGFGPKFDLFHYAKLPCYKRVKWGWLAEPSLSQVPTLPQAGCFWNRDNNFPCCRISQ